MKLLSRKTLIYVGVIGVMAAGGAAIAKNAGWRHGPWGHGGPEHAGVMFDMLDANGDDQVTREEINERRRTWFQEADANDDGALNADELRAAHEARREQMRQLRAARRFAKLDANNDGEISPEEFSAHERPMRFLSKLDTNWDGVISREEAEKARGRWARWRERHGHDGWRGDAGRGPRHDAPE